MPSTRTKTIRSSGGDYTTITAWEAGEQANLVTEDEIREGVCYNDWETGLDDGRLDLDGWTADSTRYPKLTVADGHWHEGVPGGGFVWNCSGNRLILVRCAKAVIERIEATNADTTLASFWTSSGTNVVEIDHCLFSQLYNPVEPGAAFRFRTCAFWGWLNDDRIVAVTDSTATWYNCSFHVDDLTTGNVNLLFRVGTFYNCAVWCNIAPSLDIFYSACGGDYNASSDDSGPGANSLDNLAAADFNWTDPANGDFSLADDTGDLDGAGYAYATATSTDLTGSEWNDPPSIGAVELVAGPTFNPAWAARCNNLIGAGI